MTAWRVGNGFMFLAFLISVALQYNDPDALRWMVMYGAAAGATVAWELAWAVRANAAVIAVVAFGWGTDIAWRTKLEVPFLEAVTDWGMHAGGSEEIREVGGLVIVGLWMVVIALGAPVRVRGRAAKT